MKAFAFALLLCAGFAAQRASAVPLGSVLDEVCADVDTRLQRDQVTYKAMQSARDVDVYVGEEGATAVIVSPSDGAMYSYLDKLQVPPLKLYADKGLLETILDNLVAYTDNATNSQATTANGESIEFNTDGKPMGLSDFIVAYDQTKTVKLGEQTVGVDEVLKCDNGITAVFVSKIIQPEGLTVPDAPAPAPTKAKIPVAAPTVAAVPVAATPVPAVVAASPKPVVAASPTPAVVAASPTPAEGESPAPEAEAPAPASSGVAATLGMAAAVAMAAAVLA